MRRLPIAVVLLSTATMLGAAGLAETKVEVKGVHLCCGACVKGVLKQLLDHGCRAIDDFTGGDLIGNLVRENADLAHKTSG